MLSMSVIQSKFLRWWGRGRGGKRKKKTKVNWKEGGFDVVVVMGFGERQAAEVQSFDDLTTDFYTSTLLLCHMGSLLSTVDYVDS